MLLEKKNAVIFAAAGAVGSQLARTFAREGASVYLSGRRLEPVQALAEKIKAAGGWAQAAQVDALDERAVEDYVAKVQEKAGALDVGINAIGISAKLYGQGIALVDLEPKKFMLAPNTFLASQFLTARALGRRMRDQKKGVLLTLSTSAGKLNVAFVAGLAAANGAVEAMSRTLACELGPAGVRVVCIRPEAMPETDTIKEVFELHGTALGVTREQFADFIAQRTAVKRLPTVAEVAETITFLASDRASALTATVLNLSLGHVVG